MVRYKPLVTGSFGAEQLQVNRGDFLLGVSTVVGGALLTIFIEILRGWFERRQRRQDRRDGSQHEWLLALQDEMVKAVRAAGTCYHEFEGVPYRDGFRDTTGHPLSDKWRASMADFRDADFKLDALRERIDDEELRADVERFQRIANGTVRGEGYFTRSPELVPLGEFIGCYKRVNRRVGELLREGVGESRIAKLRRWRLNRRNQD